MSDLTFDWSILLQIPLVAAFIWYSIKMQQQYQESMSKRDEAYLRALDKISDDLKQNTIVITKLCDKIE